MSKIRKENTFKKYNYKSAAINRTVHGMASRYCQQQGVWISRYIEKLIIDDLTMKEIRGEYIKNGIKRSPTDRVPAEVSRDDK